jgi:hypothetical protein
MKRRVRRIQEAVVSWCDVVGEQARLHNWDTYIGRRPHIPNRMCTRRSRRKRSRRQGVLFHIFHNESSYEFTYRARARITAVASAREADRHRPRLDRPKVDTPRVATGVATPGVDTQGLVFNHNLARFLPLIVNKNLLFVPGGSRLKPEQNGCNSGGAEQG